jgi:hypothetical protein
MSYKMQGRVIAIGEPTGGTSKAGKDWNKQDFVIETDDKYNPNLSFTVLNDKNNTFDQFRIGTTVEVDFNVGSKEYQGRWFTNCNAFKVTPIAGRQGQESAVKQSSGASQTGASGEIRKDGDDESDLPF